MTSRTAATGLDLRGAARERATAKVLVFAVWLTLVGVMVAHHVYWRDEVRALSLAIGAPDMLAMLRDIHGEGHPALWYVLLRGGYALLHSPSVLEIEAVLIGGATAALLLFRSPFPLWQTSLFLFSGVLLFEYTVMARNYGIGALCIFAFAALYERHRDRGIVLGAVLMALANTSVPATLLAGCFVLFWLLDLLWLQGMRWTTALRTWLNNAGIAAIGAVLAFTTVYPPAHDVGFQAEGGLRTLAIALLIPAAAFQQLLVHAPFDALLHKAQPSYGAAPIYKAMSVFALGSTLGLLRRPAAFVAAISSLTVLSLFFTYVYWGAYRHAGLWFVFLIALYWIAWERGARDGRWWGAARGVGLFCLLVIAALQLPMSVQAVADAVLDRVPTSRIGDLGRLLNETPELRDAIVMSEPDYLIEALPAYASNPIYMMRDGRFHPFTLFRSSPTDLDLDKLLEKGHALEAQTGRPVLVAMQEKLDPAAPAHRWHQVVDWNFDITPDQVRHFLACTTKIADFPRSPAMDHWDDSIDESFTLYRIDPCP